MDFWMPIIKDIILSLSAMITVILAVYGIKSWRRELAGKTRFDIARRLLQATYRIREEFWGVRSRFITAAEFPSSYSGMSGKNSNQENYEAFFHVYKNRLEPLKDAIQEFDVAALEAEVLWGDEIKKITDEIRSCLQSLRISIEGELSNILSGTEEPDSDYKQKVKRDVSASRDDKDPLSNKMRETLSQIEQTLKPYLRH